MDETRAKIKDYNFTQKSPNDVNHNYTDSKSILDITGMVIMKTTLP